MDFINSRSNFANLDYHSILPKVYHIIFSLTNRETFLTRLFPNHLPNNEPNSYIVRSFRRTIRFLMASTQVFKIDFFLFLFDPVQKRKSNFVGRLRKLLQFIILLLIIFINCMLHKPPHPTSKCIKTKFDEKRKTFILLILKRHLLATRRHTTCRLDRTSIYFSTKNGYQPTDTLTVYPQPLRHYRICCRNMSNVIIPRLPRCQTKCSDSRRLEFWNALIEL